MVSSPLPPQTVSAPPLPLKVSFPAPRTTTSAPLVPVRWSALLVPTIVASSPLQVGTTACDGAATSTTAVRGRVERKARLRRFMVVLRYRVGAPTAPVERKTYDP